MPDPTDDALYLLNREISNCFLCPRLTEYRQRMANLKRKSFSDEAYWGRPVPNFGDPLADRLIVGLAPAANGANRTGRMFTGDRSGDWLYRALHKAGVANQAEATDATDGLKLTGVMITAVAHCAPPDNKPLPEEISTCSAYLDRTFTLRPWKSILCLGGIAWNNVLSRLGERRTPFGHGSEVKTASGVLVVGCYHPSQQNTFTRRLTEAMLDDAIRRWLTG